MAIWILLQMLAFTTASFVARVNSGLWVVTSAVHARRPHRATTDVKTCTLTAQSFFSGGWGIRRVLLVFLK